MLLRQFVRNSQLHTTRWFTRSSIAQETAQKSSENVKKTDEIIGSRRMHRVSNFDKKVLVWVKRYPSIADVPSDVTEDCILSARSKARIKTCNYMIVATIIGCIGSILLGKRQAARGESLVKQREDWFQQTLKRDKNE